LTFNECIDKFSNSNDKFTIHSQLFGGFMGLNKMIGSSPLLRHSWFIILVLSTFLLTGCGESEETVNEETQATSDQALTNFSGIDTVRTAGGPVGTLEYYEKQAKELLIENTSLKQNIIKLEQENRIINARLNELAAKNLPVESSDKMVQSTDVSSTPMNTGEALPPSQSTYDNAIDAFRSQQYDNAVRGFKAIADGGGEDDLVGRARYWLGETYFAQKNYNDALQSFQDVLKMNSSEKKADAQYMIARSYENLGSKAKAKAAYEKVVKNYPMSKNVKSAKARWAKL
jgi:tol-pal system protein YbgF